MAKTKNYRNIRMFNHCWIKVTARIWNFGKKVAYYRGKKCVKQTFCIVGVKYYGEYIADHLRIVWNVEHWGCGDIVTLEVLIREYSDGSGRFGVKSFKNLKSWKILKL